MEFHGKNFIGQQLSAQSRVTYSATNPANGEGLPGEFTVSDEMELDQACQKAAMAFETYRLLSGAEKAKFLRTIAEKIMNLGDDLVQRTMAETGLPEARIVGERGRTCAQLNLFANLVEEGSWLNARIDFSQPDRSPLPKPDVRSMERAIGPVVVFGASNFPLAFSTAGGDTASALAAGCPVIYKAHPAHPGTSELVASAISEAVKDCGLDEGVFSMLHGYAPNMGKALVMHPNVKAVGFTGSLKAGRAIFNYAATRPEPIPVYAEMGSSNPVILLPDSLEKNQDSIAEGLSGSICLGAGQFCTNPGLTVVFENESSEQFITKLAEKLKASPAGTMVHHSLKTNYDHELGMKCDVEGVKLVAQSSETTVNPDSMAQPALIRSSYEVYKMNPALRQEVFGPCTYVMTVKNEEELTEFIQTLEGHLTASVFLEDNDMKKHSKDIQLLENKVGRLIFNQYPTGVEVCASMSHGGPYPASTDNRSTSVGSLAIHRFTRQVCFQNCPQDLLPDELKDSNPLNIQRHEVN